MRRHDSCEWHYRKFKLPNILQCTCTFRSWLVSPVCVGGVCVCVYQYAHSVCVGVCVGVCVCVCRCVCVCVGVRVCVLMTCTC